LGAARARAHGSRFAIDHDAGAVDRQVQRHLGATAWDVGGEGPLTAALRAEVGPVRSRPTSRNRLSTNPVVCRVGIVARTTGFDVADAKQHRHPKARLDGGVAAALLVAALAWMPTVPVP
jgi:hypothetical protein